MTRRSEMHPGDVFVLDGFMRHVWPREALVVLNAKHEIGFWTGMLFALGDVMPSVDFVVIAPNRKLRTTRIPRDGQGRCAKCDHFGIVHGDRTPCHGVTKDCECTGFVRADGKPVDYVVERLHG